MRKTSASKTGMSLVEVLLALVILSITITPIMIAMTQCLATIGTARKLEMARALILRVDIENPIESVNMTETTESGTFDDAKGYEWFRDIQMVDEAERPGLFLITTRVQWSERGRDSFEETTMYRYAPDAESVTSKIESTP